MTHVMNVLKRVVETNWVANRNLVAGIAMGALLVLGPLGLQAQVSPELLSDGRVTFRLQAPTASDVKVSGQFGAEVVMTKDEKGLWSGTTAGAVPPGVHEYRMVVDKLRMIDPRNSAVKPQRWPNTSILHVPAEPPALWDRRAVPHGTLATHGYASKALGGAWREVVVYQPAGTTGPLPVLYLAHGYSDEQKTWTVHGKAHWILDALIAAGQAEPMLVVMPDAHALSPDARRWDEYAPANSDAFARELREDVIPLIETQYAVRSDRSGRAFAGLSMGGHHALTLAMQHTELFSQIGAFSAAVPPETVIGDGLEDVPGLNERLALLWIACGDKDFLFDRNEGLHRTLLDNGVAHEYIVTLEEDHSWPVWRRYLARFVPRLFQE